MYHNVNYRLLILYLCRVFLHVLFLTFIARLYSLAHFMDGRKKAHIKEFKVSLPGSC